MNITVTINGETYERDVDPRRLLIHFIRDDLDPPSDVHGSAEYRRHLAKILVDRAIAEAGG